jgi:hypothetical protein
VKFDKTYTSAGHIAVFTAELVPDDEAVRVSLARWNCESCSGEENGDDCRNLHFAG